MAVCIRRDPSLIASTRALPAGGRAPAAGRRPARFPGRPELVRRGSLALTAGGGINHRAGPRNRRQQTI